MANIVGERIRIHKQNKLGETNHILTSYLRPGKPIKISFSEYFIDVNRTQRLITLTFLQRSFAGSPPLGCLRARSRRPANGLVVINQPITDDQSSACHRSMAAPSIGTRLAAVWLHHIYIQPGSRNK